MLLAIGCGSDDDGPAAPPPTVETLAVPDAWGGTWRLTFTPSDSTASPAGDPFGVVRVFCPGDTLAPILASLFFTGTAFNAIGDGAWDDDRAEWDCSMSMVEEDCTVPVILTFDATRSGTRLEGVLHVVATICEKPGSDLVDRFLTVEGERLSLGLPGCGDPGTSVIPADWNGVWRIGETEVSCATGEPIAPEEVENHLLCAGTSAHAFLTAGVSPFLIRGVSGGFSETSLDGFVAYEEVVGDCLELTTLEWSAIRTGDTFAGTLVRTTYVSDGPIGECEGTNRCEKRLLAGSLLDADPPECDP